MNKVGWGFPSQITTVQEGGTASLTDVAEPSYRLHRGRIEEFRFEHGQPLRTAEPDHIESENTATERCCRVHTLAHEFLVYNMCVWEPLMTHAGGKQDERFWTGHCFV